MKHRIKLYEFENTDEMYKSFYFTSKKGIDYAIEYGVVFNKEKKDFQIGIYYNSDEKDYKRIERILYKKFNQKIWEKAIYKLYKKYYLTK